ncbi:MAG: glycosyltransferase family 9 protein [Bryobacteraceae bacterium]
MTSTSCSETAEELLARAISGESPVELPRALLEEPCNQALFSILAEGLADRFEPALCDVYAQLFSQAIAAVVEGADAAALVSRYGRVRRVRRVTGEPSRVFVLSRVTLGADVAVTSVLLDAAKRRFPRAEIVFVGPPKNYQLFEADPRIRHAAVAYRCGSLRDRLAVRQDLTAMLDAPDSLIIDSDSRLTQLGLLPICAEDRYHLFESRAYGGATDRPLPELAAAWAEETLGVAGAKPFVALAAPPEHTAAIAVSLGVGENPAKRLPDPFEESLLHLLGARGAAICIDKGAGGEEAARVERAVERSGARATFWNGSFAGFAAIIAASRLYIGYDSAGQHVAAAAGVPLVSVFAGFPVPRMFDRWRPRTNGGAVIRIDRPDAVEALKRVRQALANLL